MPTFVETEAELRRRIPPPPPMVDQKRLALLETHSARFVELCGFGGFATRRADGVVELAVRVGAGRCVRQLDATTLVVSDDPELGVGSLAANVEATGVIGALLAIPGIRETLRVNGRARVATDAECRAAFDPPPSAAIVVELDEHYLHCPKAFIRSKLWEERSPADDPSPAVAPSGGLGPQERAFLARSPFALLGTCGGDGDADVSPRGDPAGFIHSLGDGAVLMPERPGNRLLDNLRNILAQPQTALTCLVPGEPRVLHLRGRARLTADEDLLAPLAVQGKVPVMAVHLELAECVLADAPALARGSLWDRQTYVERSQLPKFGRMLIDQMDPNGRLKGLKAAGLELALQRDTRKGLY